MREKELRLALICYGGISLAVYMHGVTKEIWNLARASKAHHEDVEITGSRAAYQEVLRLIEASGGVRLRVFSDIIAGASAGGINGIFLAQAVATGQSLEPLTEMWLERADVEHLLDPDARPTRRFTKFWATPIAWAATRGKDNVIDATVEAKTRGEVRAKLSHFVRARWFEPPFGGKIFTGLLLDALDHMAMGPAESPLVPSGQPTDLMVTVTDFRGFPERLRLNSPAEVTETEHRLIVSFRAEGNGETLGETAALAFAGRATASFPGAFPPFTVGELDAVLDERKIGWGGRDAFLARTLPKQAAIGGIEETAMIDGSVLANAPFSPAMAALKHRPARREVDRRFVYIDPKPDGRLVSFGHDDGAAGEEEARKLPGFFATIFRAMSDIPREQPIRDNVEALASLSARVRKTQRIVVRLRDEVEDRIDALLGRTLFLDRPTRKRLENWRAKAQAKAVDTAGYSYAAYGHLKLSGIVDELTSTICAISGIDDSHRKEAIKRSIDAELVARDLDRISGRKGSGASAQLVDFFLTHDVNFRIRRLRAMARRLDERIEARDSVEEAAVTAMYDAIYEGLAPYLDLQSHRFHEFVDWPDAKNILPRIGECIDRIGAARDLTHVDIFVDDVLASGLAQLPKPERRDMLLTYLGFPFYDIATLAILQGEGGDEFEPIKIDRISPDDATAIRKGGADATLKGTQFNSFGAFFSRAYRENDYLWGRLHGAERLIDIVASSAPSGTRFPPGAVARIKRDCFRAIVEEERGRLTRVAPLIAALEKEIG